MQTIIHYSKIFRCIQLTFCHQNQVLMWKKCMDTIWLPGVCWRPSLIFINTIPPLGDPRCVNLGHFWFMICRPQRTNSKKYCICLDTSSWIWHCMPIKNAINAVSSLSDHKLSVAAHVKFLNELKGVCWYASENQKINNDDDQTSSN